MTHDTSHMTYDIQTPDKIVIKIKYLTLLNLLNLAYLSKYKISPRTIHITPTVISYTIR